MTTETHAWKYHDATGCQIHSDPADCDGPVQACHIISQQALRKRGLDSFLWDRRNRLFACRKAHTRSDLALERFPVEALPDSVWGFAADTGLVWWLERFYGERQAA